MLTEPPIVPGQPSDLLRFDGNFHLFFFSDPTPGTPGDPADSPADVGIPAAILSPALFFTESGSEGGLQGLFGYAPGFTDPGANTAGAIYNFISDIPEPNSLTLLVCGLGICGLVPESGFVDGR